MQITAADIRRLCPNAASTIVQGLTAHAHERERFGVTTPLRLAHFMAQLAHESAHFQTTREYASGKAYEGRKDLGNTQPGDGTRYRGRGLIQITGRANAREAGRDLGRPYEEKPEMMEGFPDALLVSLWFWKKRGLNELADRDDLLAITKRINGGTNGLADRKQYFAKAKVIWAGQGSTKPVLRQGAKGTFVSDLQRMLTAEGFKVLVDGDFGEHTREAVVAFQKREALAADGVVGRATWAALESGSDPAATSTPAVAPMPASAAPTPPAGLVGAAPAGLGGTIASVAIKAIPEVLAKVAADPRNSLQPAQAGEIARTVQAEVIAEVASDPRAQHVTNSEPWYRSRVTIGALISMAVPLLGLVGVATDTIDIETATSVVVAAGTVIGGLVTLYGRWAARRPIGA